MTARIVFADGSKQLAHNNDDLFERWMLKREALPEPERKPDSHLDVFLPDFELPNTYQGMCDLQEMLGMKKVFIQNHIADLSMQSRSEGWTRKYFLKQREPLAAAATRVDYQLTQVKSIARTMRDNDAPRELDKWELSRELIRAQQQIIELQAEIIRLHERYGLTD